MMAHRPAGVSLTRYASVRLAAADPVVGRIELVGEEKGGWRVEARLALGENELPQPHG